jgi:hypothetical protein
LININIELKDDQKHNQEQYHNKTIRILFLSWWTNTIKTQKSLRDSVTKYLSRVYIYIKNSLGQVEKCPAFVGESLLTTITRMRVKGF